ncbi:5-methyltetrahydropteroyltriglutamate--homocysteine S-methyltransferase [Streptococcus ratti]|uniref:Methionine synthase n=1 Tax=Streptococcus ratti FA-1 = DSM 20564 TaxID=699248 RepID=A0ABN0GT81_STRRT|nr:5-methyltetrahydropteroyltriglutamate--homocysteine S-methyltransferase [Streptococcus ratti]EJN93499.1 putative methionine synthase [Streptococcus ratti FA-1 = DSM 20564]EMP71754.1 putative methionine synthase [Streptococcus ratti FA-1 = DSM 20564]QEY07376.1 5-methyltetrahydropteroyltriglutamate--homocysteine S-methyltransferase [Streptococcus ratti]VEI59821.1 5-methyltetrahydropteroyltriglutamate--homocysteine methyltransferase [Streptococcus mutans]
MRGKNDKKYFEHVGSFLRPEALKKAREEFEAGKISKEQLRATEDQLIKELVDKEIAAGLEKVTDGEFRRAYWHLDFFWGFHGIDHVQAAEGYHFHDETTKSDSALIAGKISGENHPFVADYRFLYNLVANKENVEAKYTIPAPAQFYFELIRDADHVAKLTAVYPDFAELRQDIKKAYLTVIEDLFNAGLRTLQVDDCTWGTLVDEAFLTAWGAPQNKTAKQVREELADIFLTLNNDVYQNVPAGLQVNTHVCRGNYHSTWASSGGYDPVAHELFGEEAAKIYFLEFDSERAGGFEPLAEFKDPDKVAVLGLITSKDAKLEDKEVVIARLKEASQYLPLDQLWLSTQCGFASTEEGNILTEEDQWAKLGLVKEIIDQVWR